MPCARARRPALISVVLLLALGGPAAAQEPAAGPVETIEALHGVLLDVMKNADTLGYPGRVERVGPAVEQSYDMRFMARKSVGRHWKKLSEAEQQGFVDTFSDLTVATYANRFNGWTGESFETVGQEPGVHDTIL